MEAMTTAFANLTTLLTKPGTVDVPNPGTSQNPQQMTTSTASSIVDPGFREDINKLTEELKHLNVHGYPIDLGEFREDILAIKNGVHDIKKYSAPPVQDESEEDPTTTTYKIGDFHFPLKTVQEIFDLEEALKYDLQRNDNNREVAKFFMSIVSFLIPEFINSTTMPNSDSLFSLMTCRCITWKRGFP